MSEYDADDVVPESEQYQEVGSVERSLYERQQAYMMDKQATLRADCIENGENAEKFLNTSFGQYIVGQAELETEQAMEALTKVDADDIKAIRKLQGRIQQFRSLASWIENAIEQGNVEYDEYINAQQAGEG